MTEKDEEKTPRIGDVRTAVYDGTTWRTIEPITPSMSPTYTTGGGTGVYTTTAPHTSGTYTYPGTTSPSSLPPLHFPALDKDETIVIDDELPSREQFVFNTFMKHKYSIKSCDCGFLLPYAPTDAAQAYFTHLAQVAVESCDKWDELVNLGTDDENDDEDMQSL